MSGKRYDKTKMLKILTTYIMARKTRRGGMLKTATSIAAPVGRAVLVFGKEYGKDYGQKKLPKVAKGIYNDPSLASDPKYVLTGRTDIPAPNIKISSPNLNVLNDENLNSNIMTGGKSKRNKRRKNRRKTRKNKK